MKVSVGTPSVGRRRSLRESLHRFAEGLRNNSPDKDPSLSVPLTLLIPVTITCSVYSFCRAYIWFKDIFSLRELPASAFATANWSKYIPHI
jgi:hypothetical protein